MQISAPLDQIADGMIQPGQHTQVQIPVSDLPQRIHTGKIPAGLDVIGNLYDAGQLIHIGVTGGVPADSIEYCFVVDDALCL